MSDTLRIVRKIRKCLELAADTRGNPTMRETAWRQAQALISKHGLQLDNAAPAAAAPAVSAVPHRSAPEWCEYWAQRTGAEAMRAGVQAPVLCRDGWYVPA